ncbi:SGNH/GDSL hydrolase family protein [Thermomonas carbonis]|uniref:SGNH/GDSL hydrolase family protein n=1 Tax=Thermomonas carbonis TaxID=1463158 RepID=A0A7G9SS80_9GAMM|nr:SGNH/GDSL hydrolase family protein [Thermomonas carbonis]QNN70705.1 SGNH/GDSL hydrolase family protein [Thermomonas carbonis]GHC01763.1 lysophospholipase [Thermomonas carbonis]
MTQLTYLALGDSYTIGEGVDDAGRWPVQLAAGLRASGIAIDDPRIIATTGWTTDELSAAMDAAEPLGEWEFVSLLIGVNNQYRGRSVDDYLGEFTRLLQRAIALAGDRAGRVLVLSIPDWGVTPFAFAGGHDAQAVADDLDAYNAAAREACDAHGVAFVDITTISRDDGGSVAMLADDGLHPSAAQYARWADAALPMAIRLLGGDGA